MADEMPKKITSLYFDVKAYSDKSLDKVGAYRYAESKNFEILNLSYMIDSAPAYVIDIAQGASIPMEFLDAIADPSIEKWAYNADYARICISAYLWKTRPDFAAKHCMSEGKYLSPDGWKCTRVLANYKGIPHTLKGAGKYLFVMTSEELAGGSDLTRVFCKPTIKNGDLIRTLPSDDPKKWELFKAFNLRDAEVNAGIVQELQERQVMEERRLSPEEREQLKESVWDEYSQNQAINDRGILLDEDFVNHAVEMCKTAKADILQKIKALTGVKDPSKPKQIKEWLSQQGTIAETLDKKTVDELMAKTNGAVHELILLYKQLLMNPIKKYEALLDYACEDHRIRGLSTIYGGGRSGQWSEKLISLKDLPTPHLDNIEEARTLIKAGDYKGLASVYPDVINTLCQLIGTALIAEPGKKLITCCYDDNESRVLSHLADEKWRVGAFSNNEDVYSVIASKLFGVPVEKNGINSALLPQAELADSILRYGGEAEEMERNGALDLGIKKEDLKGIVERWRCTNPAIVDLWKEIDNNFPECYRTGKPFVFRGITFTHGRPFKLLKVTLPSGRSLRYEKMSCYSLHVPASHLPKYLGAIKEGRLIPTYEGIKENGRWGKMEICGAEFVEDIVKGITRDIFSSALYGLRSYSIVSHTNEEIVIECSAGTKAEDICHEMEKTPDWIPGLPLHVDGYESTFYTKK